MVKYIDFCLSHIYRSYAAYATTLSLKYRFFRNKPLSHNNKLVEKI